MATKTVLKLLLAKYAPLSVEMQNAVTFDQAIIKEDGSPEYVDNDSFQDYQEVSIEERKQAIRKSNNKTPELL